MLEGRIFPEVNPRICVGHEMGTDGSVAKVSVMLSKCYSNNYGRVEVVAPQENNDEKVCKVEDVEQSEIDALLNTARDEAFTAGKAEGRTIGFSEGFEEGFAEGQNDCPTFQPCPEVEPCATDAPCPEIELCPTCQPCLETPTTTAEPTSSAERNIKTCGEWWGMANNCNGSLKPCAIIDGVTEDDDTEEDNNQYDANTHFCCHTPAGESEFDWMEPTWERFDVFLI